MILGQVHVYPSQISFDLLDAGNVVYHPNYLILCERARHAGLEDAGYTSNELWQEGLALAVLECHSLFKRAIQASDKIAILTKTTEVGGSKIVVQQTILPASTEMRARNFYPDLSEELSKGVLFEARYTLACVKLNPLGSTRLPEKLLRALVPRSAS